MDIIAEIRWRHFVSTETISSIARSLKIPRPIVRKRLHSETEPVYSRQTCQLAYKIYQVIGKINIEIFAGSKLTSY